MSRFVKLAIVFVLIALVSLVLCFGWPDGGMSGWAIYLPIFGGVFLFIYLIIYGLAKFAKAVTKK